MKLDFSEIRDWKEFEDLASAYFRSVPNIIENSVTMVAVDPSGEGGDGGRDILVSFKVFDSVVDCDRKWVVQCKFHERAISKKELSQNNIPSLIHEYGANGYLLICKNGVTSKVSEMFENLRKNCRFDYSYQIWEGSNFIQKIISNNQLLEQYFPKYYKFKNSN
jgi:Restriction endonuclease